MNIHGSHELIRTWKVKIALPIAVAAFFLAAFGLYEYERNAQHAPDYWAIGYHSIQLFFMHAPHLPGHVPWQLHAGRWLATGLVIRAFA